MFTKATKILDIEPILNEIAKKNKSVFTDGWGLNEAKKGLELLGNPQNKHKTIHVAGTSGKGSTSYYITSLLMNEGFKVGTIVSPHIVDIRERAMINLKYADDQNYIDSLNRVIDKLNDGSIDRLSYYEAIVFMAFDLFAHEDLDFVVVETGLGGLYDTTNLIDRDDKLSVITKIGFDHTDILGKTLEEISRQKAGIMKVGSHAIVLEPEEEKVKSVFDEEASKYNVSIEYVSKKRRIKNVPEFSAENMLVAESAVDYLAKANGFERSSDIVEVLKSTKIPGRFDVSSINGKTVIFDGAHNLQKLESLVSALKELGYDDSKWVFGLKNDKQDVGKILKLVDKNASSITFTSFFQNESNQRLRDMAESPEKLEKKWKVISEKSSKVVTDPQKAYKDALKTDKKIVVVSGSMYLVSELLSQQKL